MNERIDPLSESSRIWRDAIDRGHPEALDNPVHESLMFLLGAVVEQQRVANILKLDEMQMRADYTPGDEVLEALGLN